MNFLSSLMPEIPLDNPYQGVCKDPQGNTIPCPQEIKINPNGSVGIGLQSQTPQRTQMEPLTPLPTRDARIQPSPSTNPLAGGVELAPPEQKPNWKGGTTAFNGMMPLAIGGIVGVGGLMLNKMKNAETQSILDYKKEQNKFLNSFRDTSYGTPIMEMGGQPMTQNGQLMEPIFVQAEEGEKILNSRGYIYNVKADKKHEKMKKDEITDMISPDSYMLSNKIKLKKKDAEKIILGSNILVYSEDKKYPKYQEANLGDLFTEDEHSLSELADILRKKYPTIGDDDKNLKYNQFTRRASEENRKSRQMYLMELIKLNEAKNNKNTEEEVPKMSKGGGYVNLLATNSVKNLNKINWGPETTIVAAKLNKPVIPTLDAQVTSLTPYDIPKINTTPPASASPTINPTAYVPTPTPTENWDPMEAGKLAYRENMLANGLGSMLGIVGTLAQENNYAVPELVNPKLKRRMSRDYYDYLDYMNSKALNTMSHAAFSNSTDFGQAMTYMSPMAGKVLDAKSQLAAQAAQTDIALENAYQSQLAQTRNQQAGLYAQAANETTKGFNDAVSSMSGFGINALNQGMGIRNSYLTYMNKVRENEEAKKARLATQALYLEMYKKMQR